MAVLKKYRAINLQKYMLYVDVPGRGMSTVTFDPGYGIDFNAILVTKDEVLQNALEKDKRFNKDYVLESIGNVSTLEINANAAKEEPKEIKTIEVENINEAKMILAAEPYNIPKNRMNNAKAIENRGLEVGVKFEYKQ